MTAMKPRAGAPALRAQVFKVPVKARPDVVRTLEILLEGARVGDTTGIAFAATLRGGAYIIDVVGDCHRRPTFSRGCVRELDDMLSDIVHKTHIDERR